MTKIVGDTTSGLPLDLAAWHGIAMLPQLVMFGEETYRDDTEMNSNQFLQKLKASPTLPKTAAPPPSLYNPIFEAAAKTGETVIVIAPTGTMSGTVRSAETAKADFPNVDIRVIDTKAIAGSLGSMLLAAQEMVQKGKTADEIEAAIRAMIPLSRTYFVVDTLEYLQKGGRIGAAKALLGELLQMKPILQIKDGQAAPCEQARTKKRATARLIEMVCEQAAGNLDPRVCVMHIDAEGEAEAVCQELSKRLKVGNIPVYLLPPAIVTHAGPKALAVGFFVAAS
jgi:DegV family protein with EDD domain